MKFQLSATAPKTDVLFLALYKKEKLSAKVKKQLGAAKKEVEARMKAKDFEGDEGQSLTLFPSGNFKKVILIGRGEKSKQMPNAVETLGAKMAGMSSKVKSVAIITDKNELSELAEGFVLGRYEFTHYKKENKKKVKLEKVTFITKSNKETKAAITNAKIFTESSKLTRDLVNLSSNDLTPADFETHARKIAKSEKMAVKVLDEKKLKQLGCGAFLSVGQGASVPARMIILEYKHKTESKRPNMAFVGKGITFDTGGINLKPSGHIETMKQDMAGAATVLATMQAIAKAKIPGYFLGVLACAENAISDRATNPGDIVKAYNGKTIEVNNTDAEGRLVLADALTYTEKTYKPKFMVNIATLTGAVSVALGYKITAVMGNNDKLIKKILKVAEAAHERIWQLPLDADFIKATEGKISDLTNISDGVRAGSTMGGAFLSNFVEKTPWVHFDIGGTAWADKPTANTKYGATAAGLRTFIELAKQA